MAMHQLAQPKPVPLACLVVIGLAIVGCQSRTFIGDDSRLYDPDRAWNACLGPNSVAWCSPYESSAYWSRPALTYSYYWGSHIDRGENRQEAIVGPARAGMALESGHPGEVVGKRREMLRMIHPVGDHFENHDHDRQHRRSAHQQGAPAIQR